MYFADGVTCQPDASDMVAFATLVWSNHADRDVWCDFNIRCAAMKPWFCLRLRPIRTVENNCPMDVNRALRCCVDFVFWESFGAARICIFDYGTVCGSLLLKILQCGVHTRTNRTGKSPSKYICLSSAPSKVKSSSRILHFRPFSSPVHSTVKVVVAIRKEAEVLFNLLAF